MKYRPYIWMADDGECDAHVRAWRDRETNLPSLINQALQMQAMSASGLNRRSQLQNCTATAISIQAQQHSLHYYTKSLEEPEYSVLGNA